MIKIECQVTFAPLCISWSKGIINHLKKMWTPVLVTSFDVLFSRMNGQINLLSTKLYLSDLKTQSVPRSKHTPSGL